MTESDYMEFEFAREFWPQGYGFPQWEHDDPEAAARAYAEEIRATGTRARVHKLRGNRWRVLRHVGWEQGVRNMLLLDLRDALDTITDPDFVENTAIFSVADYYVQFMAEADIVGEAVGAAHLGTGKEIVVGLPERLGQLGWDSQPGPSCNHERHWPSDTEAATRDIATLVIETFIQAYDVSLEQLCEGLKIEVFQG